MISSYSRDPNKLFYSKRNCNGGGDSEQTAPPTLKKQNRYKNVILKIDLSEFLTVDTPVYEAIVDWYNLSIKVFEDSDDSLNNVPCFEGSFQIPCDPRPATTYVREAFQFLARGHSIHHPQCTCFISLDDDDDSNNNNINNNDNDKNRGGGIVDGCLYDRWSRATELGLLAESSANPLQSSQSNHYYFQPCQLETNGCMKKIDEMAKELGVMDLNGIVKVSERVQMPLLKVLIELAGMQFTEPGFLSSPLCCVPLRIQSAQDILAAAKAMYPKPYLLDCRNTASCEAQSLIQDLQILKQRYLVRAVDGVHPNTFSVFYFNTVKEKKLILQHMIDKYIQNLWHKEVRESCLFLNGPSQREVERMLIEENLKPTDVQNSLMMSSHDNDFHGVNSKSIKRRKTKSYSSQKSITKMVGHLKHFGSNKTSTSTPVVTLIPPQQQQRQ
jgi:hypothetical protein